MEHDEVSVRLTFHELLFKIMFSELAARVPNGQALLADLGGTAAALMADLRFSHGETEEQKKEALLNAKLITERFFDGAESRRAAAVKQRSSDSTT